MHQSWAHVPSQQQQSQSLVEVSDASYYYSVFSCLCVTTANRSATLEAHIHPTPHCDLPQTHFFPWVSYWSLAYILCSQMYQLTLCETQTYRLCKIYKMIRLSTLVTCILHYIYHFLNLCQQQILLVMILCLPCHWQTLNTVQTRIDPHVAPVKSEE